ncbi:hypothetical protein C4E44_20085 [Pseudomonas sp. MWU12-2312b]|uniref:hypothetical protein n=1 Tax=Pseudomonas moorei TaxID=395599 RepID=UPI000D440102|nr:hypothetical protein [Pseudomonas moorei]PPA02310.1 hypothetical protein C4E44_20085 [Pseudomonas sp. MWU12-2312b]
MQLRSEIQLISMMKSMNDVIIPAISPDNDLAIQQAHLVVAMLKLMTIQLPLQFRFDRDELQRLLASTSEFAHLRTTDPKIDVAWGRLNALRALNATMLEQNIVEPTELAAAVKTMRTEMSALMAVAATSCDQQALAAIEKTVMALSKAQLKRDRSLLASLGWEADPSALPLIEKILEDGYVDV